MQVNRPGFLSRHIILCFSILLVIINSSCNTHKEIKVPDYDETHLSPAINEELVYATTISTKPNIIVTNTPKSSPTPKQKSECNDECSKKHHEKARSLFRFDMETTKTVAVSEMPPKTYVKTIKPTLIYLIPLRTDFLLEESKEIQMIDIPVNIRFQIVYVKTYSHPEFGLFKIALLGNSYNTYQTWIGVLILELEDSQGKTIFAEFGNDDEPTVTFIATRDDIYFNKVVNILTALKQISYYQDLHGPFQKNLEYSYLELIGLRSGELYNHYLDGLNKYRYPIRANGVCAIATGISMLLTAQGYESFQIKEKWTHQDLYHQSPFSFPRRLVDAAIEFGPENYQKYDLKWIQQSEKYLTFDVHLFSTDLNTIEIWGDGMSGQSEVGMIVSMHFTSVPINQVEQFDNEINRVEQFRLIEESETVALSFDNQFVNYYSLGDSNVVGWARLFYDIANLDDFRDIIEKDNYLKDILLFSTTINSYTENGQYSLQSFLMDSDWYSSYLKKNDMEYVNPVLAIQKGTTRRIIGEPMQCLGFVIMLTDLYPSMGFPDVSGAVADTAGKLVPDFVYGVEGKFSTGYGEFALVGKSLTIDDYNPGDFFVLKGYPGHVGAILAKKDGKLLVADSNRLWNGRVNIFVVNENNFDEVFGLEKYIVLGHR